LGVFALRQFPAPIDRLFELARSLNPRIARPAVGILAQFNNSAVRALAMDFMNEPARWGDAAELLASNYEPRDFQMIEDLLQQPVKSADLHHFGIGVRHLLKAHCPAESAGSLLLLYEKGPCSLCRRSFVERLIELRQLPDWMADECRFDASEQTRKIFLK